MSEMKRVELTTVSSSQKQKKVKWKQSTYRFILTLGESSSETCPEYSLADLVKNDKPMNGTPFDEPDEDKEVAAIAQRFEAKYGPKGLFSGKRKRTQEMDDYYDPGEGYDEDDPFIDNTEAHDEVVPAIMTTQHGGFYINQGKLDFRYLDEDSSDAFISTPEVKKKKKRVLDSDSEEETGAAIAKKFKAMKAMKRKKQLENKEGGKQQRKKHSGLEDRDNIFKKKKLKNLDRLKLQKSAPDSGPQKETVTPSVPSANAAMPSVMPGSPFATTTPTKTTAPPLANHTADDIHKIPDTAQEAPDAVLQEDSSSKSGDEGKGDNQSAEKNTLLPAQLPPELLELVENIKREAKECKEKKLRFFSDVVNKLLLDIDLGSRNLPWGSRTAIFNHLGEHLPCGKFTLQRRAKKLRESQQEGKLKLPMQKLKDAIIKVMPGQEEQHELEVQKARSESELKDDVADVREEASTESEEEERTDNRKKPRGPRRKFQWSSEIRDLLLDIVSTKMKLFNTCKSRHQTAEEYLRAFLDSEIKPMWPQGWMQTRMLFKESKKAHEDLTKGTLQPGKPRKAAAIHDVPSVQVENTPVHLSKTEDVIEISSTVDSDDEHNHPALVNSSALGPGTPSSGSTSSHSTPITPSVGQVTKQSFKAPMASTPVTHLSQSSSTVLMQKTVDSSPVTTLKRVAPIPVLGSKSSAVKSLAPVLSSSGAPAAGAPGSVTQQASMSQPASTQQKSAPSQQTANSQQQKHPQELTKAAQQQQNKAAIRSSTVVGSMHNSTWANANSIVPASKSINPFVAVHRIPEATAQKLSLGGKSSILSLPQNQMLMPSVQQQEKTLSNTSVGGKPQQAVRKSQQSEINTSSSASSSDSPQVKKPVNTSLNSTSSKRDSQTKTIIHHHDGAQKNTPPPSPHFKPGLVGSTSCSPGQNTTFNSGQKLNQQNQNTKPAAGIVSGFSQQNCLGNADISSRKTQSNSAGGIRQHSPPAKLLVSSDRSASPVPVLLDISSSPSMSRSNTPSPQKSPMSPEGNAALSLYEQIKSHIWHQEAMEDQALKNLALALNCGGSGSSRKFGNGSDAGNHSGNR